MGTLSVGRLRLHQPSHLLLLTLMGILFVVPSLAQLQRNTASKNIWRRQYPLPADEEEPASLHIYRRQSDDDAAAAPPADDASASTSDLPPANPAENEINAGGNAVGRQAPTPMPPPGKCHECMRYKGALPGADDCLDKAPDPAIRPLSNCNVLTTKETVRCLTIQMDMKGTRDASKSKIKADDKKDRRMEARGCMHDSGPPPPSYPSAPPPTPTPSAEECALMNLNLKLEDNKCIKGTYQLEHLEAFARCSGWRVFAARINPNDPYSQYLKDGLRDNESTEPAPGKPPSKDASDYGLFYGEYGQVQYADLKICVCKEEGCNNKAKGQLGSAEDASPAARKLRMGILRLLPV